MLRKKGKWMPIMNKANLPSQTLYGQMKEAEVLGKVILQNLEGLGYGE